KGVYRSRKPCAAVSQFMCRATRRKASGALHRNPRNEKGLAIIDRQALVVRGAQGRNRTTDTGIFSPLLYRLSYLGAGRRRIKPGGGVRVKGLRCVSVFRVAERRGVS